MQSVAIIIHAASVCLPKETVELYQMSDGPRLWLREKPPQVERLNGVLIGRQVKADR